MNLVPLSRFEWERVVLQVRMPVTAKLVALALATFARRDGESVRPGTARLAEALGIGRRTVERYIGWLISVGLLERVSHGGSARRLASVYRLVIAEDLPNRVEFVVTPATQVAQVSDGTTATQVAGDPAELPPLGAELPPLGAELPPLGVVTPATQVATQQVEQARPQQGDTSFRPLRTALRSTTNDRVAQALALVDHYEALGE